MRNDLKLLSRSAAIVLCAAAGLCAPALAVQAAQAAQAGQPVATPPVNENGIVAQALAELNATQREYFQHVTTLSSPFFEGRGPGTRGNVIAAEYMEWHFRKMKLEPGFLAKALVQPAAEGAGASAAAVVASGERTFRQTFTTPGEPAVKSSLLRSGTRLFATGTQYEVVAASGNGTISGELVSVGYAIAAGKDGYNSFANLSGANALAGKIALILRYEPMDEAGKSLWAEQQRGFTDAASLSQKIRAAVERGAAGIVLVSPPNAADERAKVLENVQSQRLGPRRNIPIVMATPAVLNELLGTASPASSLDAVIAAANAKGESMPLGVQLTISAEILRAPAATDNVAAIMRGSGTLADQYVIIGGHYDHLGYGFSGSRAGQRGAGVIHPGADDNASGMAGIIMAAKQLATRYATESGPNRRSLMFVGFSGEELGLIGSRFMTRNMPFAASQATAMLNLDMVGRVRYNKVDVSGVGSAEGFADLLAPLFAKSPLKVRTLPGGQGPSDHASFYASNIPVLHFFTGLHPQYHMPEDTYDLVNPVGGMQIVDLIGDIAVMLGGRAEPLAFTPARGASIMMEEPKPDAPTATPQPVATPQPSAAKPAAQAATPANPQGAGGGGGAGDEQAPPPGGGMGAMKVRFGIAPGNYGDDEPGIEVADVYAGTSAADGGLLKGDRMTSWNGKPLLSVEQWMTLLVAANPGDKVQLEVKRGSETKKLIVTLKARDQGDR